MSLLGSHTCPLLTYSTFPFPLQNAKIPNSYNLQNQSSNNKLASTFWDTYINQSWLKFK